MSLPWPSGDGTSPTWRQSSQVRVLPGVLNRLHYLARIRTVSQNARFCPGFLHFMRAGANGCGAVLRWNLRRLCAAFCAALPGDGPPVVFLGDLEVVLGR